MAYNRFLYNTALYNAGREEVAAIATSLIQAHTGPHIQAVVGSTGGVTFLSDFVIQEGEIRKPPSSYRFPDLSAWVRAQETGQDDIPAYIRGWYFDDLPAAIFPSDRIPDLKATIFGLLEANLMATILGKLGEHDLPASIQATVAHLAGQIFSLYAPNLQGQIFGQPAADLGGLIWAPLDLPATLTPVHFGDLPGNIRGFQIYDLPGQMLGVPAAQITAFVRAFASGTRDVSGQTNPLESNDIPASITSSIPGPDDIVGTITGLGGFGDTKAAIRSIVEGVGNIGASIKTGGEVDLPAVIQFFGADNISGRIGTIPLGERDRFLPASLQPMTPADLGGALTINKNVAFLGASIQSLHDDADLGAYLRVSETFVTAILTVTTLASRSLRATIGNPACAGGSANAVLAAVAVAQHKGDIGALIESYAKKDLGASVNTGNLFLAFDTISISFSPYKVQATAFKTTDTISITFSPFRGKDLGAVLTPVPNSVLLGATITATFPLAKVVPAVNRLTAADLRLDREQNIQEIRLQLEGTLLEYLYVNGTNTAFIRDPNEDWKINIRSFKPLAEGLFGDHAAGRICRLGSLESYTTLDQAVRACIQAVIGYEDESNLGATISAAGQLDDLGGLIEIWNNYGNLGGLANRVYPADFNATINANAVTNLDLGAFLIPGPISDSALLGASITQLSELDLGGTIIPVI